MAAGSHIQVTNGSGPFLATGPTYTESSTSVLDQKVVLGLPYIATYICAIASGGAISNLSTPTNGQILQIMAGSALNVRLRRLTLQQAALGGSAVTLFLDLLRLTSAGSGGQVQSANPVDTSDSSPGASVMTQMSSTGTTGVRVGMQLIPIATAQPTGTLPSVQWTWPAEGPKALTIPAGTSNGIALHLFSGTSNTATLYGELVFEEAPF